MLYLTAYVIELEGYAQDFLDHLHICAQAIELSGANKLKISSIIVEHLGVKMQLKVKL